MIRFMHERLRAHAESVAFFGGGAREKEVTSLNFTMILFLLSLWLDVNFF